ncbi:hypothetical protein PF005_g5982 [Phytophthora fragariae]|uniref:Uncharacterized protein n=1 Tax=Phytophthora fragariae TaxID=53985 RepID=A0A6A3LPZ9_9STRA|nr:hypothetical protein PF003_g3365 [Phytophthora fragariae]KAE8944347.1 hypothetical protein PF009_g5966 [Phytophthora fragariae]KAE9021376.1 hypothetical protein PF011_g4969 [Phytophthora fragariae]KAE9126365.1 hypothetical protein PF010_g5293 [Phytophthora fragariae]KAE9127870.1 hypothetical protein PF007_g5459 [Phytophthora fragariae]
MLYRILSVLVTSAYTHLQLVNCAYGAAGRWANARAAWRRREDCNLRPSLFSAPGTSGTSAADSRLPRCPWWA